MAHIGTHRRQIDWDAIGQDYQAGVLSLREMARKHDCSHSAIANFASRHGWVRGDPIPRMMPVVLARICHR